MTLQGGLQELPRIMCQSYSARDYIHGISFTSSKYLYNYVLYVCPLYRFPGQQPSGGSGPPPQGGAEDDGDDDLYN